MEYRYRQNTNNEKGKVIGNNKKEQKKEKN